MLFRSMRGYFVRGAQTTQSATSVGVFQSDATAVNGLNGNTSNNGAHNHKSGIPMAGTYDASLYGKTSSNMTKLAPYGVGNYPVINQYYTSTSGNHSHNLNLNGDPETRPKNMSVNYIIKY